MFFEVKDGALTWFQVTARARTLIVRFVVRLLEQRLDDPLVRQALERIAEA